MATMTATAERPGKLAYSERFVIFASSLGTIFEWYDFYLYAVLAPFFAALFFPPGNQTAALLSAFATYAAGFLVRPFGAPCWLESALHAAGSGTMQIGFCAAQNFRGLMLRRMNSDAPAAPGFQMLL